VGKDIPIVVNVAGQHAEGRFSYAPPRIFSVGSVPAAGGLLKISGANLGSAADLDRITVKIMLDGGSGSGGGGGGGRNSNRNIASEGAPSESPQETVFIATNVQIGQAHTELVCEVPSPYRDGQQWGQASPTRIRRPSSAAVDLGWPARVVVVVAEQISPPENFFYLAPPRPVPQTPSPMSNRTRQKGSSGRKGSPLASGEIPGSSNSSPSDVAIEKSGDKSSGSGSDGGGVSGAIRSASSALPLLSASVNSMSFRRAPLGLAQIHSDHNGRAGHVQAQSEIAGLLVANGVNAVNRGTVLAPSVSASSAIIGADVTEQPLSWTPDTASDHCLLCGIEFTLFRRRHHCRLCGALVCGSCSGNSLPTTANRGGHEVGQLSPQVPPRALSPARGGGVGVMVRACDQCFTLRKLRSEQAAIISNSRLLMNLLPPDEGADFRQTLVIALAEGARQCAERLCAREAQGHHSQDAGRNSGAPPSPTPRLADAPRGALGRGGGSAGGNWPGAVLAAPYLHHTRQESGVPTTSVIRPVAHPTTLLDVGF